MRGSDAITLSSVGLASSNHISERDAITAFVIAVLANNLLKIGMALLVGSNALAKRALPGLLGSSVGLLLGLWFSRQCGFLIKIK